MITLRSLPHEARHGQHPLSGAQLHGNSPRTLVSTWLKATALMVSTELGQASTSGALECLSRSAQKSVGAAKTHTEDRC